MDHFLVGSRSFLLAISQGRKLPATAHWWFSSYSKLCGSLSRTSTKGEREGGGEKIIWDKRIVPIVPASSPVMARMTLCWAQCLRAGGGPRPPWGIRRFIVSVQWSEKLQAPPVILCYFLAPDMMRPCLDPSLLSCCQVTTGKGERSTLENVPGVYMPER